VVVLERLKFLRSNHSFLGFIIYLSIIDIIISIEGLSVLFFPIYFHTIIPFLLIRYLLGTACLMFIFLPAPGANQYTSYSFAIFAPRSETMSIVKLFSSLNFLRSLTLSLAIDKIFIFFFSNFDKCSVSKVKWILQ
jgi:hypothetical protein